MAHIYLAVLHCLRREVSRVQHLTEAALALASQHDYPHWYGMSRVIHGWTLVMLGQPEAGLAEVHAGLAAREALGTSTSPFSYLLLAEVYAAMGQTETGLRVLVETQEAAQHLQEYWVEPELYRLKGELLLGLSRQGSKGRRQPLESEAEACFRAALDLARRQQAKAPELRAAMSLSQLWQVRGRHAEARQVLAEIHSWFTEGFATPDLRQAKALLTATRRRVPATPPSGCPALPRAL